MKRIAALAVWLPVLMAAQNADRGLRVVSAVRSWNVGEVTRVAIEVSGDFEFRSDRLHNPDRVYYDILRSYPRFDGKKFYARQLDDKLVKRFRVAETQPGVTRIVLDLDGNVEATASKLSNPNRLIVELRISGTPPPQALPEPPATTAAPPETKSAAAPPKSSPSAAVPAPKSPAPGLPAAEKPKTEAAATTPLPAPPVIKQEPPKTESAVHATPSKPPVKADPPERAVAEPSKVQMARTETGSKAEPAAKTSAPKVETAPKSETAAKGEASPKQEAPVRGEPAKPAAPPKVESAKNEPAPKPEAPARIETVKADTAAKSESAKSEPSDRAAAAKPTSLGENSLVRTLGLKLSRVVIDPGHGGHDQGTEGPRGLLEKDLVLDIALRVGKLIESRMGAEVIYTRNDDTFIPLEGRTALANEKKADLFLSIHANSSALPRLAGVETYYLNIKGSSKDALDVAARENASSQKSIFELADVIQKIAKYDKAEESLEFAKRIQASLYAFSARNIPGSKNRGVRTAPFVVLIGAHMPSVLAEIGFLSNAREETLLKRPDYRQKLAEALFRGVSRYADSLSHFDVASAKE